MATTASELEDYNPFRSYSYDSDVKPSNDFRLYLPPPGHPRTKGLDKADIHVYSKNITSNAEASKVFEHYPKLIRVPFTGVTTDGKKVNGAYSSQSGAPTKQMVAAAESVLGSLSEEERKKVLYDIDAIEWRMWSNPEILFNDNGLRLEFLEKQKLESIFKLVETSTSPEGYVKIRDAMRTNHFLGDLVNSRPILNEFSYNFCIYGTPSATKPWGWQLYGHHLCVNIFVLEEEMVISPVFIGAEPNFIDEGEWKGTRLFTSEAEKGLQLMKSLSPELKAKAQIYKRMHDPTMPEGRWHPADERHMGGAFHDNRIIPVEGIPTTSLSASQSQLLLGIITAFHELLPSSALGSRLAEIQKHWDETYFSWIGGFGDEDPYYYRVQSPVLCLEFDHHCGIFLMNSEPAKCHIHTVQRMPNGGDYGREILRRWRDKKGMKGKGVGTVWDE